MKKPPLKALLKEFAVITLGSLVYAVAFNWFFQPNALSFGGFTGVAQIIHFLVPVLPVGILTIVMNVPLFILGVRRMGLKLLFSSLYAMAAGSLLLDLVGAVYTFAPMEPLLACIYGGVLMGCSFGLMLRVNATTGGTELLARLLKFKLPNLSIGRLCLIIDLIVVSTYALVFRSLNNALYGMIALYICSLVMDTVIYGSRSAQLAYLISDRNPEISRALLDLNLGITILPATGGYSGNPKQVVLCAFKRNQAAALKQLVHTMDPNAFLIVTKAHDVLGKGFGSYSPESL